MISVTMWLTPELHKTLSRRAESDALTLSSLVRSLLARECARMPAQEPRISA